MASTKWSDDEDLTPEPELRLRRFLADRNRDEEDDDLMPPAQSEDDSVTLLPAKALPFAIGGLAVVAVAGIVWYAYSWSQTSVAQDELPIVTASDTPIKEKPESEGGLVVPHQDKLVLNDESTIISDEEIEHLLPPPEEPQPFEQVVVEEVATDDFVAVAEAPAAIDAANEGASSLEAGSNSEQAAPEASGETAPIEAEPLVTAAGPEAEANEAAAAPEEIPDEIEEVLLNLEAAEAETEVPQPKSIPIELAASIPATDTTTATDAGQVATQTQQVAVPTDSGFLLQLSSVKSESGAKTEWDRLQKSHPGLLGQMGLTVEKAVVDGTTYFRVLTGPFPTKATANDLCAQLKAQNQTCLVKKK